MAELIYLLHFDEPLHHAKHYLGSTARLIGRLKEHACGDGARLTQVLHEQHKGWIVAALFQPITAGDNIRQLELATKRRKNSVKYCPICTPDALAPKGTIQIPLPKLHSSNLKESDL